MAKGSAAFINQYSIISMHCNAARIMDCTAMVLPAELGAVHPNPATPLVHLFQSVHCLLESTFALLVPHAHMVPACLPAYNYLDTPLCLCCSAANAICDHVAGCQILAAENVDSHFDSVDHPAVVGAEVCGHSGGTGGKDMGTGEEVVATDGWGMGTGGCSEGSDGHELGSHARMAPDADLAQGAAGHSRPCVAHVHTAPPHSPCSQNTVRQLLNYILCS